MSAEGSILANQAVLKTVGGKTLGGSTPPPSAIKKVVTAEKPLFMVDALGNPPKWFGTRGKYYRKLPNIIMAVRIYEDFNVGTPEGVMQAKSGDWLIQGVEGELYACKHSVFKKTYEEVK